MSLLVVSAVVLVLEWIMPGVARPGLVFGVRVPGERAQDPVVLAAVRTYRRWIVVAGGAVLVGALVGTGFAGGRAVVIGTAALVATLVVSAVAYLRARRPVLDAKRRENWYAGHKQGVAVDTSLRTSPEPFPWWWVLAPLLVSAATVVAGAVSRESTTTPVITQMALTALIVALLLATFRSRADLDPATPATGARRHRIFLARMGRALLILAAGANATTGLGAWTRWTGHDHSSALAVLISLPSLAGVAVVLIVAVRTGQEGSRVSVAGTESPSALVARDDDARWHAGVFYVNRDDPAIVVPRRFGVGWTFNFGNRLVWMLAAATAGVAVALWTGAA